MNIKNLFLECLQEEINSIKKKNLPVYAAWNISDELTCPSFNRLVKLLLSDPDLVKIYSSEDNIKASILRAFDRYLINISFQGELKYRKRMANRVFKRWVDEIRNPNIEIVILASLLNLEVNRPIKIGDIELVPIPKSGKVLDMERKIYELLGYRGVREIRRTDELAQFHITYFLGGNALRVKGSYKKRPDFYKYPSFPEPGYDELQRKVRDFVFLLRLFKYGDFIVGSYHSTVSSPFTPGEFHSGETKYTSGYQYPLVDRNEIRRLKSFSRKILPLLQNMGSLPLSVQIGIEYLNSSYEKREIHEKFIDIMISLDALAGTEAETSFRIALRTACFLTTNRRKRPEIYQKLREALKLRGKLIHGNVHPKVKTSEIEQSKLYVEDIVRELIVKLLVLNKKGQLKSDYKSIFEEEYIL